ncbi:hypothetical protein EDC04DRAFT_2964107 [Pisolithus marmoratus]|nr:hypothetical protein EDC04DRAFT_2964107 [Pisolithus marmoratus]
MANCHSSSTRGSDQPWSAQEEWQIISHAWCQPQSKVIYAYSLWAIELVNSLKGIAKENDVDGAIGADKKGPMHDQSSDKRKCCSDPVKLKSQKCKASSSSEGITSKCQWKCEGDHAQLAPTYEDIRVKESTDGLAVQLVRCHTVTVMSDQDQMPSSLHDFMMMPSGLHYITEDENAPDNMSKPKPFPVMQNFLLTTSSTNVEHAALAPMALWYEPPCSIDEGQQQTVKKKGNVSDKDKDHPKAQGMQPADWPTKLGEGSETTQKYYEGDSMTPQAWA